VLIGVAVGAIGVGIGVAYVREGWNDSPGITTTVTATGGPPPGTANVWMDTNGGTCTRSSTPVAYSDAAACRSMNAGFQNAQCGDLIEIKNGDYTSQGEVTIYKNPAIDSCARNNGVTIRGESEEGVSFFKFSYGTGGQATSAPHNLTLSYLSTRGIEWNGDDVNDVMDHIDGGSFAISGNGNGDSIPNGGSSTTYNDVIENSDWGPCDPSGTLVNGQDAACYSWDPSSSSQGQNRISQGASHILIKNNVFHDYYLSPGNPAHFECIWQAGGDSITLAENVFYHCSTNGIAMGANGVNQPTTMTGTWVIENNWCLSNGGDSLAENGAQACFKLSDLPWNATTYFLFNSSNTNYGIFNEEWNQGGESRGDWAYANHVIEIGNLQGQAVTNGAWCLWDANNNVIPQNIHYNIYSGSGTGCAGDPATNSTILSKSAYNAMFVDPAKSLPNGDLCLSGSPGSTTADNYVAQSALNGMPYDYLDYNGVARPHSGNLDAGACER
jgi:hypothetical protein